MKKGADDLFIKELGGIKSDFSLKGWMTATSGNLSCRTRRIPLEFLISVSGRDKSVSRPDDFVRVDRLGKRVRPTKAKGEREGDAKPSAEAGIHAVIYNALDVGAVLHVHTPYNTYASLHSPQPDRIGFEGLEMIKALGIWERENRVHIPIVPNLFDLEELASAVALRIALPAPGILIRGHGLYAWGGTLAEAKRNVEAFEFLFHFFYLESKKIQAFP